MLQFEHIFQTTKSRMIKQLSRKTDSAVLLVERENGAQFVLRIYSQEIPAYRALVGHCCKNLPYIYRACMQDGLFLVEEEFIDGVSLQEMISGGARMDEARTVDILSGVSGALTCLHQAGFIHRDVKPEHVMLTAEGRTVLLDLDASMRIILEKPGDTQLIGTAVYAAPEQFGLSRSDCRTDIYALGILINEMLTGVHPAVTRYRSGPLAEVIGTCIEMNPADRYQTAAELMEAARSARSAGKPAAPSGSSFWPRKIFSALAICILAFAVLLGASDLERPDYTAYDPPVSVQTGSQNPDVEEPEVQEQEVQEQEVQEQEVRKPEVTSKNTPAALPEQEPEPEPVKADGNGDSPEDRQEGTEKYLQLYMGGSSRTVYYNYRRGCQSAAHYTQDGTLVDETWNVYADPQVGRIHKWDEGYQGWTLVSERCAIGSTGYFHAEKDGLHYAIQVLVMGEPMSAYTEIPDMWNLAEGYLEPKANVYLPDEDVIEYPCREGEEVTLYLVAMRGFDNLQPSCSSPLVTIEPYSGSTSWEHPVFVMKFRNPEAKNTIVKVTSNHTNLTFCFTA